MGKKRSKASKSSSTKRIKKEPEELSLEHHMYLDNLTKLFERELRGIDAREEDLISSINRACDFAELRIQNEIGSSNIVIPEGCKEPSTTKRRRSCSPLFAVPKDPAQKPGLSRSVSQSAGSSNFQTPMNCQSTVPYSTLITPKISQNTPLAVLRRPRQGEWAISMSGSPLLVSSVPHDNTVNVNIPMEDGSVVSILPQRGLKRKDIPGNMSDHALKQLEDIYHNLDVLLHTGD